MDNLNLVKKLPLMLTGLDLEQALTILPEYDPGINNENTAARLIALSDMYKVFVPTQMSKEIYPYFEYQEQKSECCTSSFSPLFKHSLNRKEGFHKYGLLVG